MRGLCECSGFDESVVSGRGGSTWLTHFCTHRALTDIACKPTQEGERQYITPVPATTTVAATATVATPAATPPTTVGTPANVRVPATTGAVAHGGSPPPPPSPPGTATAPSVTGNATVTAPGAATTAAPLRSWEGTCSASGVLVGTAEIHLSAATLGELAQSDRDALCGNVLAAANAVLATQSFTLGCCQMALIMTGATARLYVAKGAASAAEVLAAGGLLAAAVDANTFAIAAPAQSAHKYVSSLRARDQSLAAHEWTTSAIAADRADSSTGSHTPGAPAGSAPNTTDGASVNGTTTAAATTGNATSLADGSEGTGASDTVVILFATLAGIVALIIVVSTAAACMPCHDGMQIARPSASTAPRCRLQPPPCACHDPQLCNSLDVGWLPTGACVNA